MNNILICADGGASGNFIGTLIRLFKNKNHLRRLGFKLPDNGCCDTLGGTGSIMEYMVNHRGVDIYPEKTQGADIIYTALSSVDLYPYGLKELANDVQINVIHYTEPMNINKFLTIDNLSVILIKTKAEDADQVAINKLHKNFFITNKDLAVSLKTLDYSKKILADQLIANRFNHSAEYIEAADTLVNLPKQVRLDLMTSWARHVRRRSAIPSPDSHPKLLTLDFNDIANQRDMIIDKIGKFIGCSSNDNLLQFYNEYLSKQPTLESYLNC